MSRFNNWALIALMFAASVGTAENADNIIKPDLTRRHSGIGDRQVPIKIHDLKMNDQFGGKLIPIKQWHAEFSPIGQRRSSIVVRETREKTMIRPDVIDMKTFDSQMASANGRMAYVRNFDRVQENKLVREYAEADVVTVREVSIPDPSRKQEELSMRDLNRFSFQRNHSDSGRATVQSTSEE